MKHNPLPPNNRDIVLELRNRYQRTIRTHLEKIYWASQDGDEPEWNKNMEELETLLTILWRFDKKLRNATTLEEIISSIGD